MDISFSGRYRLGIMMSHLQLIATSAECRCVSPGTAQVYDVNDMCAHCVVLVHTQALANKLRVQHNDIACFGNHHDSDCQCDVMDLTIPVESPRMNDNSPRNALLKHLLEEPHAVLSRSSSLLHVLDVLPQSLVLVKHLDRCCRRFRATELHSPRQLRVFLLELCIEVPHFCPQHRHRN